MTFRCSECTAECSGVGCRGWFLAFTEWSGHKFCVIPFELDPDLARESWVKSLCGRSCAAKAFSKFMAGKKPCAGVMV